MKKKLVKKAVRPGHKVRTVASSTTVYRRGSKQPKTQTNFIKSLTARIQEEFNSNQSYVNLVLGLLIVLVAGILVFNYFKKSQPTLGPATQVVPTTSQSQTPPSTDVSPEQLPGTYTVKENDTLYDIAQNYYKDGFKYNLLVKTNNLTDENLITVGQVLQIPKVEETAVAQLGTGGATNQTIWGEKITSDTYTVLEDDWLSKIAGRAYGDIYAFDKIAKANNISNPDLIEPGQVLKIPR